MSDLINNGKAAKAEKWWLKRRYASLLSLLLFIAISASLFFLARDPERLNTLKNYGYLGAFLISLVGNAAILLPFTVLPLLSAIGIVLYPVTGIIGPIIVGLAGGVGAGIGEMSGYMVGYSGRGIAGNNKRYLRVEGWFRRWGGWFIFITALFPFFFDLTGIVAGIFRFSLWKFAVLCWAGRTLNYVGFVLAVSVWGWEAVQRYFS